MMKRVVLEHLSGLRQFAGLIDVADAALPETLTNNALTCRLVRPIGKHHVTYREVRPDALAEGPVQEHTS